MRGTTVGMQAAVTEEIIARQPPEAQAIIRLLLAEIAKLSASRTWKAGAKTPQNSSLPPSSVHPHAKPASSKRKSKKKRGGQPGHEKHERPLIPSEDCDDVKPLKPTQCRRCGKKLSGSDPGPLRHQAWELPEIKPPPTASQRLRLFDSNGRSSSRPPTCPFIAPPGVNGYRKKLRRRDESSNAFTATSATSPC